MVLMNREMLRKRRKKETVRVIDKIDRGQLIVRRINERGQKGKGLG